MKSKFLLVAAIVIGMMLAAPPAHAGPSPSPAALDASADQTARAKEWLHRLQTGDIDHSQLDAHMNAVLNAKLAKELADKYGPLGEPSEFSYLGQQDYPNDAIAYVYHVTFKSGSYTELFVLDKDGKVAGIDLPAEK